MQISQANAVAYSEAHSGLAGDFSRPSGESLRVATNPVLDFFEDTLLPQAYSSLCFAGAEIGAMGSSTLASPVTLMASIDETGVSVRYPFGIFTSLVEFETKEGHVRLGGGLLVRFRAFDTVGSTVEDALALNAKELASKSWASMF